jgi:biofilm PGA synthesis N-glycosyltransferase PgaC
MLILPCGALSMLLPLFVLPFVIAMSALVVVQQGPLALVGYYLLFTVVQGTSALVAVRLLDEHPDQLLMVPLYRLIYEPLRAYLLYRTAYLAMRGVPLGWDKLARTGALNVPAPRPAPEREPAFAARREAS